MCRRSSELILATLLKFEAPRVQRIREHRGYLMMIGVRKAAGRQMAGCGEDWEACH